MTTLMRIQLIGWVLLGDGMFPEGIPWGVYRVITQSARNFDKQDVRAESEIDIGSGFEPKGTSHRTARLKSSPGTP